MILYCFAKSHWKNFAKGAVADIYDMHVLLWYKIRAFKNIWRHLFFPSRMKNCKICCKLVAKYCSSTLPLGGRIMTAFTFEWQESLVAVVLNIEIDYWEVMNICFCEALQRGLLILIFVGREVPWTLIWPIELQIFFMLCG